MRLLITGGAGFIGSNFIRHILTAYPDYEVINLDKLTYAGNLDNLKDVVASPRYRFIRGDICDRPRVDEAIPRADAVLFLVSDSGLLPIFVGGVAALLGTLLTWSAGPATGTGGRRRTSETPATRPLPSGPPPPPGPRDDARTPRRT